MRKRLYRILLFGISYLFFQHAHAQAPQFLPDNQPEQDACGAILLCNDTFSTSNSYHRVGQITEPNEDYSHWLKIRIGTSGKLIFKITPKLATDFYSDNYDFYVFQQDQENCNDIQNLAAVRGNSSTPVLVLGGVTGLNNISVSEFSSSNHMCKYLDVTAGQTIYILINNYGPKVTYPCLWDCYTPTKGYRIDFSGSTCTFIKGSPSEIDSVGLSCDNNKFINLHFSKPILCSSIEDMASDFEIDNADLYLAIGVGCNNPNAVTNNVRVEFAPYISQPGNYELKFKEGTDGNTLIDLCGDQIPIGEIVKFVVGDFDSSVNLTLCPAQMPYTWNNQTISNAGNNVGEFTTPSYYGCDSNVKLNVALTDTLRDTTTVYICPVQLPYLWNGILLNNSGQNVADFYSVSSNGCDSVSTLNLKIIQGQNHSLTINSCGPLAFEGNIYGQSTNLQDTVLSIFGCDSLYRNIAIIIHPLPNPINVFIDTVGCGYLTFKDKIYRTSTNLVDTLLNQNNCDSAYIHYQIIVYPNSQPKKLSETISDCYVVNFEGHSYFRDTTIIMLLKTTLGCDSILRTSNIVIQELDLELYSNPPEPVIGDYITLTTKASVPYSILGWLPSSRFPDQTTDIQSLIIQQKDSFGVIGQSENGCIDTAYIYLKPDSLTPVALMPNAFSPNGDGLNDEFKPFFVSKSGYVIKRFQIFDRWGKLVYKASNTKNASWNGRYGNKDREATVGAYFYYIDIEFIDNTKASFKGEINLIK